MVLGDGRWISERVTPATAHISFVLSSLSFPFFGTLLVYLFLVSSFRLVLCFLLSMVTLFMLLPTLKSPLISFTTS